MTAASNTDMDIAAFQQRRATRRFGTSLVYEVEVDSTNRVASELVRGGRAAPGLVVVAERQSAGRGTSGRSWDSQRADGLWCSLVVAGAPPGGPLVFWPALALADVLQALGLAPDLKWPNDVLVDDRKIAGLLVEALHDQGGRMRWIIGLGLNLSRRDFGPGLEGRATSIEASGGPAIERLEALSLWLDALEKTYFQPDLIGAFVARSSLFGRERDVEFADGTRGRATPVAIDGDGRLIVDVDGRRETWTSASRPRFL